MQREPLSSKDAEVKVVFSPFRGMLGHRILQLLPRMWLLLRSYLAFQFLFLIDNEAELKIQKAYLCLKREYAASFVEINSIIKFCFGRTYYLGLHNILKDQVLQKCEMAV